MIVCNNSLWVVTSFPGSVSGIGQVKVSGIGHKSGIVWTLNSTHLTKRVKSVRPVGSRKAFLRMYSGHTIALNALNFILFAVRGC